MVSAVGGLRHRHTSDRIENPVADGDRDADGHADYVDYPNLANLDCLPYTCLLPSRGVPYHGAKTIVREGSREML